MKILIVFLCIAMFVQCSTNNNLEPAVVFSKLQGDYLGQQPPGSVAVLYAPGLISTGMNERDITITPDGKEVFFGLLERKYAVIMHTKQENGRWTEPKIAQFSGMQRNTEPHITPDGSKIMFLSTRPKAGEEAQPGWAIQDIWAVDKTESGWGKPYNLGSPVNSDEGEFYPSVTNNGSLYFTRSGRGWADLYRTKFVDGKYSKPEKLHENVNSTKAQYNGFVAPDESYIIFCANIPENTKGGSDYYICFRDENDVWTKPINLGDGVNTQAEAGSAYVSPDGKYLFFSANEYRNEEKLVAGMTQSDIKEMFIMPENGNTDIYWIDASFIKGLRAQQ